MTEDTAFLENAVQSASDEPLASVNATGLFKYRQREPGWLVRATKLVSYEVRMVENLFDPRRGDLASAGATERTGNRRFIVIDAKVESHYGARLRTYLNERRLCPHFCVLPVDEQSKTMTNVFRVVRELDSFGMSRRHDPIIVIGGGVLMDIVGLAANLYRRSTPYVRIPTTLIGLVDAGVGIKTGVNLGRHKNRLGTYFAPAVSLLDKSFLATLSDRHISNGLAEVLKIALVKDHHLFELLESEGSRLIASRLQDWGPSETRQEVLERAIHGMLEELQPNLWEHNLQRLVDYGHTFSPAIEMRALPELLHGEAVNIDMALTTVIAHRRGLVSDAERDRIGCVMRQLRLPQYHPVCDSTSLAAALEDTVHHRDGFQRVPLPVGIGEACFVNDVTDHEICYAAGILARGGLCD